MIDPSIVQKKSSKLQYLIVGTLTAVMVLISISGLWGLTIVLGLIFGLVKLRRGYRYLIYASAVSFLLEMLFKALMGLDVIGNARAVAELVGLGSLFIIPFVISILVGVIFVSAGYFFGHSIRAFFLEVTRWSFLQR